MTYSWRPVQTIRPIAIALIVHQGQLLVAAVKSDDGEIKGWRPLGGGIEFGETSRQTIIREMAEEIGALVDVEDDFLTFQNIYEHEGMRGHEVVLVHQARLREADMYTRTGFSFEDGGISASAVWMPVEDFRSGKLKLFPEGLASVLR